MSGTGLSGWNVTARIYAWTSGPLSHPLDSDMLKYLDGSIRGAVVADCGCGPGLATRRMVSEGASKVYAIDASEGMLAQIADDPHIVKMQSTGVFT